MITKHFECPSERLDAFLAGQLSDVQVIALEQHLDSCPHCDAELTRRTAEESFWEDAQTFLSSATDDRDVRETDRALADAANDNGAGRPAPGGIGLEDLGFLDPTDDPHRIGRFAGYEISGVIGRGGMGVVMKGWDVSLDRFVAIKVLHSAFTSQSASRQRFAREAQAAAAVLHDNVIAIYGVDDWKGMPYLVMPYIKGESLQQRIDRAAPLLLDDMLGISLQIARGLAAAHDQGLVHRDIKPANILMPASVSRVIITDFGLARTADDANLTRSGVLAGTPQYMSPEQAQGLPVDGRTDLFSLGSVMYAMACGHPPFRAGTPYGVLRKITDQAHRPLCQVREDVPRWFERIVDRLLEKDPENRFETAGRLADHLEDCLAHLRQPTTALMPHLEPVRKRHRNLVRWGVLICLFIGISMATWTHFSMSHSNDPTSIGNTPGSRAKAETDSASATTPTATEQNGSAGQETLPAHLQWDFDDSQLDRLEADLRILYRENLATLREIQNTSANDHHTPSE